MPQERQDDHDREDTLEWREKVSTALEGKAHPQQELLNGYDFRGYAKKRDLIFDHKDLLSWNQQTLLEPLYSEYTDEMVPLSITYGNREALNPIQDSYGYPQSVVSRSAYHPYQLFRVVKILDSLDPRYRLKSFAFPEDARLHIEEILDAQHEWLNRCALRDLQTLFLLTTIEDRYLPEWRGDKYLQKIRIIKGMVASPSWYSWRADFSAPSLLRNISLSTDDVKNIRLELAETGWRIDPNRNWFALIRHTSFERRSELRGQALLAWDFYEAAEIIGEFLEDATGEPQPAIDDAMGCRNSKVITYGTAASAMNYKTSSNLSEVLAHFMLDPRTKVLLIVEGLSELEYIRVWCEHSECDLNSVGVRLFGLNGIPEMSVERVKYIARIAGEEGASVVVVLDNENDAQQQLENWLEEGLILRIFQMPDLMLPSNPIGGMLWESSFEDANFTPDELIAGWCDYAESVGKARKELTAAEIKQEVHKCHMVLANQAMNAGEVPPSWVKAMEEAQRKLKMSFNKPGIAACLARRYANTDRPIHRLLKHIENCAILSTIYGPANSEGGFGRPLQSK